MTWEYRVMSRDGELAIFEVYYNEDGKVEGCSLDPTFPAGENIDELKINLKLYIAALEKPVLNYDETS